MMDRARLRRAHLVAGLAFVVAFASSGCDDDGRTKPGDVDGPLVRVIPSEATIEAGASFDFDALIDGAASDALIWRIVAEPTPGTIDQDGVYTAPDTVPAPPTVLIEAESQAALDHVGRAVVTIVPASPGIVPEPGR